jgi:hypothetical protein
LYYPKTPRRKILKIIDTSKGGSPLDLHKDEHLTHEKKRIYREE